MLHLASTLESYAIHALDGQIGKVSHFYFDDELGVVQEPMFLLLMACAVIYLFLGDKEEVLMLASAVIAVMSLTFYQERKTERTSLRRKL